MTVISGIESTPNPSSFLIHIEAPPTGLEDMAGSLRGKTFSSTSLSFIDSNELPEIASILNIDGVISVYAMAAALTINKKSSAKWEVVLPLVTKALVGNDTHQNNQEMLLQSLLTLTASASSGSAAAESSQTASASSAGQVRMRMQFSNKIPIQLEGTGYLGTVQRRKLPPKFQEYMGSLVEGGDGASNKFDFFGGRKWMDRGIRYLPDSHDNSSTDVTVTPEDQELLELDAVLQTETDEIDAAYSTFRLARIVANNGKPLDDRNQNNRSNNENGAEVLSDSSSPQILDLENVDRFCDLAEQGDTNALQVLAMFVSSRQGSLPARRNALAYLGGTGDISATNKEIDLVFGAVVSALQHEKSVAMRRTAGDALSDLGDPRAIPYAITAMEDDKSKLVQWRAARILGELGDAQETVAVLKQASFSSKYAFDIAFEIQDALRKVQARIDQAQEQSGDNYNDVEAPRKGPMWKQIQEGMLSSPSLEDNSE